MAGDESERGESLALEPAAESRPVPRPSLGTSWQWQLSGEIDVSQAVELYDIDLFDAPQQVIDQLRERGVMVVCYFSAGTRESWRPDADQFASADVGSALPAWRGEHWLDIRSKQVRSVMRKRLDLAANRRCDGVEPDNVDAFIQDSGFAITVGDQLAYAAFLSQEAHSRGLNIGLKNAPELARRLEPVFDWALSEECVARGECGDFSSFLAASKAVLVVEYVDDLSVAGATRDAACARVVDAGYSLIIKTLALDAGVLACPLR